MVKVLYDSEINSSNYDFDLYSDEFRDFCANGAKFKDGVINIWRDETIDDMVTITELIVKHTR